MALSDKDIVITPNRGQSADPKIEFRGADGSTGPLTISAMVYPLNNGTLSFEGSAGQLFSITNDLSGTIFSVNDVSGIPSLEVNADGTVSIAEFGGNVGIGTSSPIHKLDVYGSGNTITVFSVRNDSTYIITYADSGGGFFGTVSNNPMRFITNNTEQFRIDSSGNVGIGTSSPSAKLSVNGDINDSKGDVRTLVVNPRTSGYTLVAADHGKLIDITTGGVIIPSGVFTVGQNITIFNDSNSNQTITATAVTCYLAGTATTGNRTLAQRGICTIVCVATNTFVISGAGLT